MISLVLENDPTNKMREEFLQNLVIILGCYRKKEYSDIFKRLKILLESPPYNYKPKILEDIKTTGFETPRQKIHCWLSNCRFVIAEDTEASGETLELEYCRNVGAITAILSRDKLRSTWMTLDFHIHSPDFEVFNYTDGNIEELESVIFEINKWVSDRISRRTEDFRKTENAWKNACEKFYNEK